MGKNGKGKTHRGYPEEFRRQMIELVRRGRTPQELSRLMRGSSLMAVSRRNWVTTTVRDRSARPAPDRVERNFTATAPNQLWVADITYIPMQAGFIYLAVVLVVWSRKIVGWAMENHLRTELVLAAPEDAEEEPDADSGSDSGNKVRLKSWSHRNQKGMGYEAPGGQAVPLIDRIHRLMHLWRAGDVMKVDQFLDDNGLRRQELFKRVLQSLIELSDGEERSLLESLSNHLQAKGAKPEVPQMDLIPAGTVDSEEI